MPETPYAKLLLRRNGGALSSGRVVAATGDSIQLSEENSSGVSNRRWEIYQYPPGFGCPAGWSETAPGEVGNVYYYFGAVPPVFTLSVWGKYLLALFVNDAWVSGFARFVDKTTLLSAPSPNGVLDLSPSEALWAEDARANFRKLEDVAASGGSGAQSISYKSMVRLATAAALPAHTRAGNVLTASANGALTVDGVAVAITDRILVKNEASSHLEHGVYVVTATGSAGSAWVLTRATDWDAVDEFATGSAMLVYAGTANIGTFWYLSTTGAIVLNTTALTFTQTVAGGVQVSRTLTAGNGLTGGGDLSTDRTFAVQSADPALAVTSSGIASVAYKSFVRLATIAALPAHTRAGNVLTASANGALTVDGVAVALNDRVLVKNEGASHLEHGVYVVTATGDGSNPWVLTRATDWDSVNEFTTGSAMLLLAGTQAGQTWYLSTTGAITLNTTALEFARTAGSSGSGSIPPVRTVFTVNVADLANVSVINAGVTHEQGDRVLLAAQTVTADSGVYTVGAVSGGTAPLTKSAETINEGDRVLVLEGNNGYAGVPFYLSSSGEFDPENAPQQDVVIGQYGSLTYLNIDTVAAPANSIVRKGSETAQRISVANGATVTLWTYDCAARNHTNGALFLAPHVLLEWASEASNKAATAVRAATFVPHATTPVLVQQADQQTHDGASGANNYVTLDWQISGTELRLRATNNRATACVATVFADFGAAGSL